MILPLDSFLADHRALDLVLGLVLGVGFGAVLERAGFGRSTKLAAQFYGTDMTVFKVMFTGILTAMLGTVVLGGLGLLDLAHLRTHATSFTYLLPMGLGGFLLGVGFIVSGYCPGTSIVATASGKLDGALAFLGVVVGSGLYDLGHSLVAFLHESTNKGHVFLPDLLGVSTPLLAAVIVVVALLAFLGAERVEHWLAAASQGAAQPGRSGRLAWGGLGVAAAFGVLLMGVPRGDVEAAATRVVPEIVPSDLASRLVDTPWLVRVLDLRAKESCAEARVPGALCLTSKEVDALGLADAPGHQTYVLVLPEGMDIPPSAMAYPGALYRLGGGQDAWVRYALEEPTPPRPLSDEAAWADYRFRVGLRAALTGAPPPPPPSTPTTAFKPRKKKGGGCS